MTHKKYKTLTYSLALGGLFLTVLILLTSRPFSVARTGPVNLFVTSGGVGNCSQASPCSLQTALSMANDDDSVHVAQGTFTGSGQAVVSITRSIVLLGGWDGSPEGPIFRDTNTYTPTLDGEGLRRVIFVREYTTPTIDGFTITGGNATGLGGGVWDDGDAGGGIYSLNASPTIQNNFIYNNVAARLSISRAFGGGLYIKSITSTAVVRDNTIISNCAGIDTSNGDGGGAFIYSPTEVENNFFLDNIACRNCSSSHGGGLNIAFTTSRCIIANNIFENNEAQRGGGISLFWSAANIYRNTLIRNTGTQNAGGIETYYDMGSIIDANLVLSNTADVYGGGIRVYITSGNITPQLTNNFIAYNQAGMSGGGLSARSDWHIAAISVTHNTFVNNGTGIAISHNMTATVVNNIIASHTLGITKTYYTGFVDADHNLYWYNASEGIPGTNALYGDPAFVNPVEHDYHIGPGSAAMDNGINVGVTKDYDADRRPVGEGFDIGADEYSLNVYIPIAQRNTHP